MIRSYRDLLVWQRAMDIVVSVYTLTKAFPQSEIYGLTSQIQRAAVSIPSNIAEGYGRSDKEFGRYLAIARGSLSELETQLELANRIGYLDDKSCENVFRELTVLGKQLNVLSQRVNKTNHQQPTANNQQPK